MWMMVNDGVRRGSRPERRILENPRGATTHGRAPGRIWSCRCRGSAEYMHHAGVKGIDVLKQRLKEHRDGPQVLPAQWIVVAG